VQHLIYGVITLDILSRFSNTVFRNV